MLDIGSNVIGCENKLSWNVFSNLHAGSKQNVMVLP